MKHISEIIPKALTEIKTNMNKKMTEYQREVIKWHKVHGLDVSIDSQAYFVECEKNEYDRETDHVKKMIELGDWFFTLSYLKVLLLRKSIMEDVGLTKLCDLITKSKAEKYITAVIKSNWTKYLPVTDYNSFAAAEEAERVAKKYRKRYTQVVPRLSPCGKYWVILGKENGNGKVLKPTCFVPAIDFV